MTTTGAPQSEHQVRLSAFPLRLFTAAHEQWEALLREYALRGIGGALQPFDAEEITRAGSALQHLVAAVAALPATAPTSGDGVAIDVPVPNPGDFGVLQGVLQDARRLAVDGELLTFPSLPEIVSLRNWLCEEVINQAAGAAPTEWQMDAARDDEEPTSLAQWEQELLPPADTAWLVGDDHNRIVAASPSALLLLGWSAPELVGQRILAVIPHRLREAHIAGFTRSVVSGQGALLGQPLALPALTRDGREIAITLILTRHEARRGRHVYLARLEPAASEG